MFKDYLNHDLTLFMNYCLENNIQGFVRLNGTSDIDWSKYKIDPLHNVYQKFHTLSFYEYTKDWNRVSSHANYYITYSASENTTEVEIQNKIRSGHNVAVVFNNLPKTYLNIDVVNGDETDLRVYDPRQRIIGLLAKGKAKKDTTGFVIRLTNI